MTALGRSMTAADLRAALDAARADVQHATDAAIRQQGGKR